MSLVMHLVNDLINFKLLLVALIFVQMIPNTFNLGISYDLLRIIYLRFY